MRYRPFAHFNVSVSAVSLILSDDQGVRSVEDWVALIYAALETGINSFEIHGRHPNIVQGLDRALGFVERRLVLIGLRMGARSIPADYAARAFEPQIIQAAVRSTLARSARMAYLDHLLLDDPGEYDLPPQSLTLLKDLKAKGAVRYIGVAGKDEAIDAYISTGAFDVLALPFNMTSGWRDRLRLKAAQEQEMAVIGYDSFPASLANRPAAAAVKRGFWSGRPAVAAEVDPYAFLGQTPNWSADEICLGFALTEPSLATVLVDPADMDRLQALAGTADRELPTGLSAQIEMARIDLGRPGQSARHA